MLETGLYSAVAPLMLLLISGLWQYPAVLEEVVKWGILKSRANGQQLTTKQGAVVGLIFGLSETILFTLNAWAGGQWGVIGERLILTVPMHVITTAMIAHFMQKKMALLGILLAMIIHGTFNYWVGTIA